MATTITIKTEDRPAKVNVVQVGKASDTETQRLERSIAVAAQTTIDVDLPAGGVLQVRSS